MKFSTVLALPLLAATAVIAAPANDVPRMPTQQEIEEYLHGKAESLEARGLLPDPSVTISQPQATFVGIPGLAVEQFPGISSHPIPVHLPC
jgi:hypothetical protein